MSTIRKRRPTLQDIAERTGVTKMTVSRYLRDPSTVSETTRQKIAQAVEVLGYIPNRAPDILSNATSKAIGVLIPSLSNQVFSSLVTGIESVTKPAGYQILLAHYGYSAESEEEKIASLLSYHVDGLILCESEHTQRSLQMIATAGVPVVETMDLPEQPIDMVVGIDHEAATQAMASEMIARGRTRILYFGARMDRRTRLRQQGYEKAMRQQGLPTATVQTEDRSSFTVGKHMFEKALIQYPDLDGVICTNDDIAVGAMLYCLSKGIDVPGQVAIAGYNALDIGKALSPTLASIETPRKEMGAKAASMMLQRLAGEPIEPKVNDLGFNLFIGDSLGSS